MHRKKHRDAGAVQSKFSLARNGRAGRNNPPAVSPAGGGSQPERHTGVISPPPSLPRSKQRSADPAAS
ncbi:hypothetical protein B0T18DRAFT_414877 [Schizothecium vesticola]|uniref:Uncharacterized protein n=1 Tax=Schizothecium vesticola TaxID=314040 RepID=A0AA40EPU9_9PEZI|nr:hypothetical protein B0T18DRAFT_414877 [Schizothecium vesticola]